MAVREPAYGHRCCYEKPPAMSIISNIFSRRQTLPIKGMTDWHSHILPGVDDGVQEMERSLQILNEYERAGVDTIWLTPHIMEDIPNTTDHLRERFDELSQAYNGKIKLHLAAENMMDKILLERLETNDVLPIGPNGDMLLVETSYFNAPMSFYDNFEKIKSKGYHPLLAHPERYNYITDFDVYKRLRKMGVRFQVNLLSLNGHYGPMVRDKALRLVSEGMVDHIGSDLHRMAHLMELTHMKIKSSVLRQLGDIFTANK